MLPANDAANVIYTDNIPCNSIQSMSNTISFTFSQQRFTNQQKKMPGGVTGYKNIQPGLPCPIATSGQAKQINLQTFTSGRSVWFRIFPDQGSPSCFSCAPVSCSFHSNNANGTHNVIYTKNDTRYGEQ